MSKEPYELPDEFYVTLEVKTDGNECVIEYDVLYNLLRDIIGMTHVDKLSSDRVADAVKAACRDFAIPI
jgi:hypothetical protein